MPQQCVVFNVLNDRLVAGLLGLASTYRASYLPQPLVSSVRVRMICHCRDCEVRILKNYISQGSVATHLMCDEIFNGGFMANSPESV